MPPITPSSTLLLAAETDFVAEAALAKCHDFYDKIFTPRHYTLMIFRMAITLLRCDKRLFPSIAESGFSPAILFYIRESPLRCHASI